MGTATYRGRGFMERSRVSGEMPAGAASFRQQSAQASRHASPQSPLPPPPPATEHPETPVSPGRQ